MTGGWPAYFEGKDACWVTDQKEVLGYLLNGTAFAGRMKPGTPDMIKMRYDIRRSKWPLLALAIHHGHDVREELEQYLEIDEFTRLREEDPCTGFLAAGSANHLIVDTSRFQTDLNRPPGEALYRTPEQSWGLRVWKKELPQPIVNGLLKDYDDFYEQLARFMNGLIETCGYLVVYDFHTYNYRRDAAGKEADPVLNPEINVGTGTLNRDLWAPVIDCFLHLMRGYDYFGRHLDVRENIRFKGGYLSRWIHGRYPGRACVLAIEVKKIFMDEWSGAVDIFRLNELKNAFYTTVPEILATAERINGKFV